MAKRFALAVLASLLFCLPGRCDDARFTLVIDAGHGGHDSGAKGAHSYEKTINLNVALAFGAYVERNCPGVKVVYTRKTDVFVPLHERASIANRNKADVFISIHVNALPGGRIARGLETYTMGMRRSDEKLSAAQRENSVITIEEDYQEHYEGYDPNSPESAIMFEFIHDRNMEQSIELARYVQKHVCASAGRIDKGVKQDVFLVLRETSMPACLIELGFITTPDEEAFLTDKGNVDKIARGIYEAFAEYMGRHAPAGAATAPGKKGQSQKRKPVTEPSRGKPQGKSRTADREAKGKPVFKVQIAAVANALAEGSPQFKGLTGVESYTEGGLNKYTYGASTDYNEIYRLRKEILDRFPEAFIIAFKDGKKMDVNQAIREFKANKR